MPTHTIRLAGPWEFHSADSAPQRVKLPFALPATGRLVRKFHRPSGLTAASTLRIVLNVETAKVGVAVNDQAVQPLADGEPHYDVSGLLESFNSICMVATADTVLQAASLQISESD